MCRVVDRRSIFIVDVPLVLLRIAADAKSMAD